MQQSFEKSSNIKIIPLLDLLNAQNQDKFKMILDRLEEKVLGQIQIAVQTTNALSMDQLRRAFSEARSWVK